MFTTIFRFDLKSFGVQGVLGDGVGSANPVTTDPQLSQQEIFEVHKHGYRGEHIILCNFLICNWILFKFSGNVYNT